MGKVKMLPYGISSFRDLRLQNRYCVDKSMYIPLMEEAGNFLFLIRPRRFGKSIFLSMLKEYYDMSSQADFDRLFEGLWIADHPTGLQGKFQVLHLDFSQADSGTGTLKENFHLYCSIKLNSFADTYKEYYGEGFVDEVKRLSPNSGAQLIYIGDEARKRGHQLFLIVDEYDNFTNNVLNEQGEAVYHALTHATGFYREVFKLYKANFSRVLMMGVSPVTMDDVTSGYNVALNITAEPEFNMMLGFSETDVREMIAYYKDVGMIKADADDMIEEMKPWYNNYCFARGSLAQDPKMFNCDMVVYYMRSQIMKGRSPEEMLDYNTRTDYTKLKKLIQLDGMGSEQHSILNQIAAEEKIIGTLNMSFPAERIFDKKNFVSLLYYYGMLTITGTYGDMLELSIPNNNVRKQYYEYLMNEYSTVGSIDFSELKMAYYDMAFKGKWQEAMKMIADNYHKLATIRTAIQGERNLQGFVMASFSTCSYYLIAPETEMAHGYCDIFLMPDFLRYPQTAHSYILELKYLSATDSEEEAKKQWDKAVEQVKQYATDAKVKVMTLNTELHLLVMQIRVHELVRLEELSN